MMLGKSNYSNLTSESFNTYLDEFTVVYNTENNQEILRLYQKLKSFLIKNPSFLPMCQSNKEFQMYEEEIKAIENQTRYLFQDNWTNIIDQEDLKVQTYKGCDQFLTRLKFTIKADPLKVFSVFYETNFMEDWMKAIKKSKIIEEISSYRKKIQNIYNLPWPLNNRHSILNVRYLPIYEMKTILIISYTPKENFDQPDNTDNLIEMVLPSASTWIECLGDECKICIIFQANKYINSIPDFIVNFILRKSFSDMVMQFKKLFMIFEQTRYLRALKKTHKDVYESFAKEMKLNYKKSN